MMADFPMLTLKDGTNQVKGNVLVHMLSLRRLLADKPVAFYELVMKARDRQHEWHNEAILDYLKGECLVELDGSLHHTTEEIVRCAVEGAGLAMTLVSPIP